MAIADDQQPHNFGHADGILGLAYNALNNAYDLTPILQTTQHQPGFELSLAIPHQKFERASESTRPVF